MKIRRLSSFIVLFWTLAPLSAYDGTGHETVGTLAEQQLSGTRALREVRSLLLPGENLATAATWADRIKAPVESLEPEDRAYVEAHPDHGTYHYCDVPFQQGEYRLGMPGTRKDDIVQILKISIEILRTPADAKNNPLNIDKRTALRLVAHLVGDLHQPLHVGCSYVSNENEYVDPCVGPQGQDDAGGNYFHIARPKGMRLHAYWDVVTVRSAIERLAPEPEADFPAALATAYPPQDSWKPMGPIETWPKQWADDILKSAPATFDGVKPRDRFTVAPTERDPKEHFEWVVSLPEGYRERSRDTVERELAKAGYRLAFLLKAIWPE